MGKLFYLLGKSASGKDTIFQELSNDKELSLSHFISGTTRPMRAGEQNGVEYRFYTEDELRLAQEKGKVIELREYQTVHGPWKYFTVDEGQLDLGEGDYLTIGTLESYEKLREYFGKDRLVGLYIETDDGERLLRYIYRERKEKNPNYAEICRRYLADEEDFSEDKLKEAEITYRFQNITIEDTVNQMKKLILQMRQ